MTDDEVYRCYKFFLRWPDGFVCLRAPENGMADEARDLRLTPGIMYHIIPVNYYKG